MVATWISVLNLSLIYPSADDLTVSRADRSSPSPFPLVSAALAELGVHQWEARV